MKNCDLENLRRSVRLFLASCDRDYEFPTGGKNRLLMPVEGDLYGCFSATSISDQDRVIVLSEGLDSYESYLVVIFGIRLSILAVRNHDRRLYHLGVLAFAGGSSGVDWRDVLRAMAILNNCGARLKIAFRHEFELAIRFLPNNADIKEIIDGFFSRSPEMQSVQALGIVECGSECDLNFFNR